MSTTNYRRTAALCMGGIVLGLCLVQVAGYFMSPSPEEDVIRTRPHLPHTDVADDDADSDAGIHIDAKWGEFRWGIKHLDENVVLHWNADGLVDVRIDTRGGNRDVNDLVRSLAHPETIEGLDLSTNDRLEPDVLDRIASFPLRRLAIYARNVDASIGTRVAKLPSLEALSLHETDLTDAAIQELVGGRDFTHLNVTSDRASGSWFSAVLESTVEKLAFGGESFDVANIRQLKRIESLRGVGVYCRDSEVLSALAEVSQLTRVDVNLFADSYGNIDFGRLSPLVNLNYLGLHGDEIRLTSDQLDAISELSSLRTISFAFDVSDEDLDRLAKGLPTANIDVYRVIRRGPDSEL